MKNNVFNERTQNEATEQITEPPKSEKKPEKQKKLLRCSRPLVYVFVVALFVVSVAIALHLSAEKGKVPPFDSVSAMDDGSDGSDTTGAQTAPFLF